MSTLVYRYGVLANDDGEMMAIGGDAAGRGAWPDVAWSVPRRGIVTSTVKGLPVVRVTSGQFHAVAHSPEELPPWTPEEYREAAEAHLATGRGARYILARAQADGRVASLVREWSRAGERRMVVEQQQIASTIDDLIWRRDEDRRPMYRAADIATAAEALDQ